MKALLRIFVLMAVLAACTPGLCAKSKTNARAELGPPDLEKIRVATTDPDSPMNYTRLLRLFQANDTSMTTEQFQYFYYGTFFQEDYDPYRSSPNPDLLQELLPIYAKERRTRADRGKMLDYANQVLDDNPVDLRQLTNRIYVYEQNRKYDLAKIWQFKLNHLLLVIAASGTGADRDSAWIVVYPQHEYDFLNLSGITASGQRFEAPHYDCLQASSRQSTDVSDYYFDIQEMLNQYFDKHPAELGREQ